MYDFAVNKTKLQLAIGSAKSSSEEDVKARYIELGGLLFAANDTGILEQGGVNSSDPEVTIQYLVLEKKPKKRSFLSRLTKGKKYVL